VTDEYDLIWEGQFVNNEIEGFARSMTFYKNGDHCSYWGHWKNGLHHGYGRVRFTNGETKEGFFENGKYMGASLEESGITSFTKYEMCAQSIHWERYMITSDENNVKDFRVKL